MHSVKNNKANDPDEIPAELMDDRKSGLAWTVQQNI